MYSIYADNLCIYSGIYLEDERYKVTSAKLTLSDNSAGQFTFTIPRTNIGYNTIKSMDTTITIKKDSNTYWEGRVLSGDIDFRKNKQFVCEGALAYLNDTIQPPYDYSSKSLTAFLTNLLQNHNSKVPANRRIQLGTVTVVDSAFIMKSTATNYTVTYEALSTITDHLGGHLVIRYANGTRYLDYLADYPVDNPQTIEFGKNLLDLAQDFDETEYCTVVIPLGASAGDDPDTGLETYVTVAPVNQGSVYIAATEAVAEHGRLEKVVNFTDVEDPTLLYVLGTEYLLDTQFDDLVLDISALDLNLVDKSISEFKLLDKVRVISKPHGLNKVFPVKKVSLDLLSPDNNSYILGGNNRNDTLSAQTNAANAELAEKLNQLKETNALEFYKFENKDEYTVRRRTRLCNIRFATKAAGLINWQAEILAHVTADEGYKANVKFYYFLNNVPLEYSPVETLESGEHIFSLYFPLEIETLTSYEWRVEAEVEHGQIVIPIGHMRGVIWGDKLVSQIGWNGYIDIFEQFGRISLGKDAVRHNYESEVSVDVITPNDISIEEEFSRVTFGKDRIRHNYDGSVIFNHTSMFAEGITWGELRDNYLWADVYDTHTW